jgi:hypothetical protein
MLFKHASQRPELMRFLCTPLLIVALIPASAVAAPVDVAAARQSLVGQWEGRLEYRDYAADKWFGIPVKTAIEDQVTARRSSANRILMMGQRLAMFALPRLNFMIWRRR